MEDNKNAGRQQEAEDKTKQWKELQEKIKKERQERSEKAREAQAAMSEGKGILHLEKPIKSGDAEITELAYDFMSLTGLDYTEAMDSAPGLQQMSGITNRQALALFAVAAARQNERLDMRDIVERIGITDTVEAVHLATFFFRASSMAGRMRITKKQ
jgi:hypothetical protein